MDPGDHATPDGLLAFPDLKRHARRDFLRVDVFPHLASKSNQGSHGASRFDHPPVGQVWEKLKPIEVLAIEKELPPELPPESLGVFFVFDGRRLFAIFGSILVGEFLPQGRIANETL